MKDNLLHVVVAAVILAASALITHFFARAMYISCPKCRTLNARRRKACRTCGWELGKAAKAQKPPS